MSYISSVLGFLSHGLSLFFTFPIYLFFVVNKERRTWSNFFILFVLTILAVIIIQKINGYENALIYYPFAVNGWESVIGKSPKEVWVNFTSKPLYYHFFIRVVNFVNTVLPTIPLLKIINQFVNLPIIQIHKTVNFTTLPFIYYYYHSIPGALTLGVYVFFILSIIKRRELNFVKYFIALPLIIGTIFYGYITPGDAHSLQPLIPVSLILSVQEMSKYNKKTIYLVFLIMILEGILFFSLYNSSIYSSIENLKKMGDYETLSIETINRLVFNRG